MLHGEPHAAQELDASSLKRVVETGPRRLEVGTKEPSRGRSVFVFPKPKGHGYMFLSFLHCPN